MVDRVADLERMREVLWVSIVEAPADKRGPLVAQLRAVLVELEQLVKSSEKVGDPLDEIAARRSARGVKSAGKGRSAV